jgi:ribosomal RNA-processing protein 36
MMTDTERHPTPLRLEFLLRLSCRRNSVLADYAPFWETLNLLRNSPRAQLHIFEMAPARTFERNVKPARAAVHDGEEFDGFGEEEDGSHSGMSEDEDEDAGHDSGSDESEANGDISNVSFGALKQAQDELSRKRKRGSDVTESHEEKLEALRSRLREMKSQKKDQQRISRKEKPAQAFQQTQSAQDGHDDSDSAPSEVGEAKSRTSKHAPASQSSRYQVSRKRQVVDVPKRVVRDPRFDAINQNSAHTGNSEKAYAFLRDYEKSEIAELKAAVKLAKTDEDKEILKRKLVSMENRIKSQEGKERQQAVLRQHRKEEKEKVQQGKKPFYLKLKDLKERALVEKFKGMKGKDREKLLDRRRRKESQKEKKRMPEARRVGD